MKETPTPEQVEEARKFPDRLGSGTILLAIIEQKQAELRGALARSARFEIELLTVLGEIGMTTAESNTLLSEEAFWEKKIPGLVRGLKEKMDRSGIVANAKDAVVKAAKSARCDSHSGLYCDDDSCANKVLKGPLDELEAAEEAAR